MSGDLPDNILELWDTPYDDGERLPTLPDSEQLYIPDRLDLGITVRKKRFHVMITTYPTPYRGGNKTYRNGDFPLTRQGYADAQRAAADLRLALSIPDTFP